MIKYLTMEIIKAFPPIYLVVKHRQIYSLGLEGHWSESQLNMLLKKRGLILTFLLYVS